MPLYLILALIWVLLAGSARLLPARYHGAIAWGLIGLGIPLLGIVTLQAGPVFGVGGLVLAAVLLSRAARPFSSLSAGEA